jgi:membrane-associated phospholipid phosphatase
MRGIIKNNAQGILLSTAAVFAVCFFIVGQTFLGFNAVLIFMCLVSFHGDEKNFGEENKANVIKALKWAGIVGILILIFALFWYKLVELELKNPLRIDMNNLFRKIPLNNPNDYMGKNKYIMILCEFVYDYGFAMPILILLLRNIVKYNFDGIIDTAFGGHLGQVFCIIPFYFMFNLQEVWYVCGYGDYLHRKFSSHMQFLTSINCFPSMHTSIATAAILIGWKEKDKVFRTIFLTYNVLIIFSTLYLRIHWTIDVIAGVIFAVAIVSMERWLSKAYRLRKIDQSIESIDI